MLSIRAFFSGLFGGRSKGLSTFFLYTVVFIFSTVALTPLRVGLHALYDHVPAAAAFCSGGGLDLLAEPGRANGAFWAASFGALPILLILFLVAGMWLEAGIYGLAGNETASRSGFIQEADKHFQAFIKLFLFNVVIWLVIGGTVAVSLFALGKALKDGSPKTMDFLFWTEIAVTLVVLNLFRNSVGYGQAMRVLSNGREVAWRCFIKGFIFTFRRLVPVNIITWVFIGLRTSAMWLAVVVLSPGYGTTTSWITTALLLQLGFVVASFLRVAEARTQVGYLRFFVHHSFEGDFR